ncbi:hypothetical protein F4813DRAFT_388678 [Daldinia decipiens]|uniref:uncharacterized protein n=1 Tax=Daldinia decipiens TaxID=326647 RepID=UPI0020C59BE2|nr:uncharacterized protein F4813DRAFT_388678 [Daldinia decipiens]KAI1658403.1 hypothetical protein F4813DRAFT_388678 [Daldinia decipiens]
MDNTSSPDGIRDSVLDSSARLFSSIVNGDEGLFRSLFREMSPPHRIGSDLEITLLQSAIQNSRPGIARILLDSGVPFDGYGINGKTCLQLAVDLGFYDIAELLLERGANTELTIGNGPLLLHQAVEKDDLETTKVLLNWGADVHVKNQSTFSPLMVAVERRNVSMVRLLLHHGADYSTRSDSDLSAIDLARGSEEMTRMLVNSHFLEGPSISHSIETTGAVISDTANVPQAPYHNLDKMTACHGFRLEWVGVLLTRHLTEAGNELYLLPEDDKTRLGIQSLQGPNHSIGTALPASKRPGCHILKKKLNNHVDDNIYHFALFVPFLHFDTVDGVSLMSKVVRQSFTCPSNPLENHSNISNTSGYYTARSTNAQLSGNASMNRDLQQMNEGGSNTTPRISPGHTALTSSNLHECLIEGYLRPESSSRGSTLQLRQTLDQYFYTHLDTSPQRDKDQVVSRFTAEHRVPKLFMVDQLWLWIINGDTLISCLPTPCKYSEGFLISELYNQSRSEGSGTIEENPLGIYSIIRDHLRTIHRAPITFVYGMADLIMKACINIFGPEKVPGHSQFFDFFEASLDQTMGLLRDFRAFTTRRVLDSDDAYCPDLIAEAGMLVEVEDIHDELNILNMIL